MTGLEASTLCVDLDATLCQAAEDYATAEPIAGARDAIHSLRESGWVIVIHTARHFNNWKITVDWLADRGFEYDQLVFGKPPARYYIDDRALPFTGDWNDTMGRLQSVSR